MECRRAVKRLHAGEAGNAKHVMYSVFKANEWHALGSLVYETYDPAFTFYYVPSSPLCNFSQSLPCSCTCILPTDRKFESMSA